MKDLCIIALPVEVGLRYDKQDLLTEGDYMKIVNKSLKYMVAMYIGVATIGICALPPLDAPTANLTEKWATNANNWGLKKMDSIATPPENCWSNNLLAVVHPVSSNTVPKIDLIVGGTNASDGRFVGDYTLKNIEAIELDVRTAGFSINPSFALKITKAGVTNLTWIYRSEIIPRDTGSNWVHVVVPMAFSTAWESPDYWLGKPTPANAGPIFNEDKGHVVELMAWLESQKTIVTTEKFAMTNLKLVGPWSGPFTSNGVSVAWLAENGLNLEDAFGDTDHDGVLNEYEFLASTNPTDSNDVFRVEIGRNAEGRPVLKWKENNRYAKYDLLEGTDLNDPFTFKGKDGFVNMQGSGSQKEANVEEVAVTGTRFYKIQIRVP